MGNLLKNARVIFDSSNIYKITNGTIMIDPNGNRYVVTYKDEDENLNKEIKNILKDLNKSKKERQRQREIEKYL